MGHCASASQRDQLEVLQRLVAKHLSDPALGRLAGDGDFARTAAERGLQRWEHAHLVAALDVLNAYQIDRLARAGCGSNGALPGGLQRSYRDDPRTRLVELLKRWLRSRAGCELLAEDEVRGMCGLCREVLSHWQLFAPRNPRSFLHTIAEVYDHLQWQLRDVLGRDRTCADLANRAVSLGRNLVSDLISYLLVGPTCLRQTDALASLEVVVLWQSLPTGNHALSGRADPVQQRHMRDAWSTLSGASLAAVLRSRGCMRLYEGARGASHMALVSCSEAEPSSASSGPHDDEGVDFEHQLKRSGLAGALRKPEHRRTRQAYVDAIRGVSDVVYLLGEVFTLFHQISDSLGDYGMICVSPWLHPVLDALGGRLKSLRCDLEVVNCAIEQAYVLSRARSLAIDGPAPSHSMCTRAHAAWERAVVGGGAHLNLLLQVLEELKSRSMPDRLPLLVDEVGEACMSLRNVVGSPGFIKRVGVLPPLGRKDERLAGAISRGGDTVKATPQLKPRSEGRELQAKVDGLGLGCLTRSSQRALVFDGGMLQVTDVSGGKVDLALDLGKDVEDCSKEADDILLMLVRRTPADACEGVYDLGEYRFHFASPADATAFEHKIWEAIGSRW